MYDIEQLAKEMREKALLMEGNPTLSGMNLRGKRLEAAKQAQLDRVKDMQKLYFNAGRWAGGARDYVARQAFAKVNDIEAVK